MTATWAFEPTVILGCAALLAEYFIIARRFKIGQWRIVSFVTATLLLLLALISPIDTLGDYYLFSAHMLQHLILLLAVPPLWLLGIPAVLVKQFFKRWPWVQRIEQVMSKPLLAWLIGVVTVWVWHIPAFFNATLANETVHIFEHLTFLVSGVIFWWPVITKPLVSANYMPHWLAMIYLFLAAMVNSILGVILAFVPAGIYPIYLHPVDVFGILSVVRNNLRLSADNDQQIGGILMWVFGGPVYLLASFWSLARWYKQSEIETALEIEAELARTEGNFEMTNSGKVVSPTGVERLGGAVRASTALPTEEVS